MHNLKFIKTGSISFVFLILFIGSQAQDSKYIDFLMHRISEQQVQYDSFFLPGIFPSYVSNKQKFSNKKGDNNMFYNGLITVLLNDLRSELDENNQRILDSINLRNAPLLKRFANKSGRPTYNYWRTDSTFVFPYTWWVPVLRGFVTLPDDMDDTVYGLMSLNAPDSTARKAHELMQSFVNSDQKKVKGWPKKYNSIPAYSVWFGKKFPVLFDVTVLSNVLFFVQKNNLPWTKADSASLALIVKVLKNGDHMTKPIFSSPNYGTSILILYHLSTLMSVKPIPELENIKQELMMDAALAYQNTNNVLEKIVLGITFLRWGYLPPEIELPSINQWTTQIEENDMVSFVANIFSYFPKILMKELVKREWGIFYPYCPAYNNALVLEYLLLRQQWLKS